MMGQRESKRTFEESHTARWQWFSVPMIIACLMTASAAGQSAREVRGAASVEPLQNEPPARIVIDPPLAEPLSHGRVVIQYRTENLHLAPVFGPTALAVSPRVGHVHISLDDSSWVWVDASGEPIIMNGLPKGPHKVLIQLENANHQSLDEGAVEFTVPDIAATNRPASNATQTTPYVDVPSGEPPAKLIVDAPRAEPLSRGVLFLPYHTENLHIVPVYGAAALAVTPRIGHIHVTVDGAPWHWADASGVPVIINGLAPGPHSVLILLVNANHKPLDQKAVNFTIPNQSSAIEHH